MTTTEVRRIGAAISAPARKAAGALALWRVRLREASSKIRLSRLSGDWLRRHERESAKHDHTS